MHTNKSRSLAWVILPAALLLAVLLPAVVFAQTDTERIDALEARVAELEAQLAALLDGEAIAEPPPENTTLQLEEPLYLEDGRSLTITGYETGNAFRYSLGSTFSSTRTLSAKEGYRLLCLYVSVDNASPDPLTASRLVDATLKYGTEYTNDAQETFFYQGNRGVYVGGLRNISAGTMVDGCLLFAVPEDVESSREPITVELRYGDATYDCVLRAGGTILEATEPEAF